MHARLGGDGSLDLLARVLLGKDCGGLATLVLGFAVVEAGHADEDERHEDEEPGNPGEDH